MKLKLKAKVIIHLLKVLLPHLGCVTVHETTTESESC